LARSLLSHDAKEKSIAVVTGLGGNTGNFGIPLDLAIFGPASLPYTGILNVMCMIFEMTFGVYFYSRGKFSVKESILNIFKLPILWAVILGLSFNFLHIPIPDQILKLLELGGNGSIALQLVIFGLYVGTLHLGRFSWKLLIWSAGVKFLLLPILGFFVLHFLHIQFEVDAFVMLELLVPIAVNNVNLSSLYHCKPQTVTEILLVTSLLSIIVIPVGLELFKMFYA